MSQTPGPTRTERDSMGALEVPADALWGASTQRAVLNFPISERRFSRRFIRALGLVKLAAGMYHLQTSGYRGAGSLLSSGLAALDALPAGAVFVEIAPLRDPVARCLDTLETLESGGTVEWVEADLPRLEPRPADSPRSTPPSPG